MIRPRRPRRRTPRGGHARRAVTPARGQDLRARQARAQAAPRPPKPAGWTTLSGRGSEHQRARREALAAFVDGTPCPFGEGFCGHAPMFAWQELDLDEYPPRVIAQATGAAQVRRLSHASCNRKAGALLGNALRKGKPKGRQPRPDANQARRSRW